MPKLKSAKPSEPTAEDEFAALAHDQVTTSNLSLHELFAQQTRTMLDCTDLDEEARQNILIAMSCPCCGAGGMSFTAKLKRT